jgi:hypothetical protein
MDNKPTEPSHTEVVDAWIKRSAERCSSSELVAVTTLGSVTLAAITDRVLGMATGRYPFLSVINPRPNGDGRARQQGQERLALVPRAELLDGLRFALIELLAVIGRLTAQILSHELHAALMTVADRAPDAKPSAAAQPSADDAAKVLS